jgi:hypothetical protein
MRRLLALAISCTAVFALSALSAGLTTACGGGDKPPLTPDTVEPSADGDAGAPAAPATPPPPK